MPAKLHFSRFEFKYLLPRTLREEIESELLYFLTLDPYVAQQPGKKYFVRSLYFDDPSWSHYYEKTDGMLHREKYRLRTYTNDPNQACATFLEIKGRHDALVFKHRAPLGELRFADEDIVGISTNRLVEESTESGPVKDGFIYFRLRKRLEPVVRIDYHRRPYFSRFDPAFRLTFDDTLTAWQSRTLFPSGFERKRAVELGRTVLEVKFSHHVPRWFHRIIQSYNLRRVSISKYCRGVEALELAPNLE